MRDKSKKDNDVDDYYLTNDESVDFMVNSRGRRFEDKIRSPKNQRASRQSNEFSKKGQAYNKQESGRNVIKQGSKRHATRESDLNVAA